MSDHRPWAREAIRIIEADFQRSADTHLIPLALPGLPGIELYFKDESSHPTGSLKHRLARSLFLYALCNGWLKPGAPVIEASSGSTAISEAYFARLLGLPFIAVMPATTSQEKIAQIGFYGGKSHLVQDPTQIYAESERLAQESGGHFMDQFTYAERATDWREQQYRRVDLPADALRASSGAELADFQPRHGRHHRDPGTLCALSPALHPRVMCRCRALGVL